MNKRIATVVILSLALCAGSALAQTSTPPPPPIDAGALTLESGAGTNAPTLAGPAMEALQFLSTGTNWMICPYGIASTGGKGQYGAGIAVGYKLSDYVAPVMRLDYYDGTVWMPSASLQLQAPITLMGKITVVPFGFAGIATPLAGKGKSNGTAVSLFGAGLAARLDFLGKSSFLQRSDLVVDIEKWSGFPAEQLRIGLLYRF